MVYYKISGSYFYKIYKNGKKKRISRKEYIQNGGINPDRPDMKIPGRPDMGRTHQIDLLRKFNVGFTFQDEGEKVREIIEVRRNRSNRDQDIYKLDNGTIIGSDILSYKLHKGMCKPGSPGFFRNKDWDRKFKVGFTFQEKGGGVRKIIDVISRSRGSGPDTYKLDNGNFIKSNIISYKLYHNHFIPGRPHKNYTYQVKYNYSSNSNKPKKPKNSKNSKKPKKSKTKQTRQINWLRKFNVGFTFQDQEDYGEVRKIIEVYSKPLGQNTYKLDNGNFIGSVSLSNKLHKGMCKPGRPDMTYY